MTQKYNTCLTCVALTLACIESVKLQKVLHIIQASQHHWTLLKWWLANDVKALVSDLNCHLDHQHF